MIEKFSKTFCSIVIETIVIIVKAPAQHTGDVKFCGKMQVISTMRWKRKRKREKENNKRVSASHNEMSLRSS